MTRWPFSRVFSTCSIRRARWGFDSVSLRVPRTAGSTDRHLDTHDLLARFEAIVCRDDVPRAKPEPDLYLEALRRLGATGATAIAFEDSHNGSLAAKRAGLCCIAVPTDMTREQDFSHADTVVPSLTGLDLQGWLAAFRDRGGQPSCVGAARSARK